MFEYGYDSSFLRHYQINEWMYERSNKFLRAFTELISDPDHVGEIAMAIARNVWDGDRSPFLEENDLSEYDAICFLHRETNDYEKEVKQAYNQFLENLIDYD